MFRQGVDFDSSASCKALSVQGLNIRKTSNGGILIEIIGKFLRLSNIT